MKSKSIIWLQVIEKDSSELQQVAMPMWDLVLALSAWSSGLLWPQRYQGLMVTGEEEAVGALGRGGTQEGFQEQRRYVFGYQANSRTSFWAMCVGVWFWFLSISILAFKLKMSLFVGLAVGLLHIKQQKFGKILLMSNCCFPVAVVVNDWLAT